MLHTLPVCVDTAVCRTVFQSTPVQIQIGIIVYQLVSTANPHCVWEPLQFYSWLVCHSTMLFMSVGTQSHAQSFLYALDNLKFLLFSVIHAGTTRSSILQLHHYVNLFQELLIKILSCRTHGPLLQGLDRSNLAPADDHNLSSWPHQQLICDSFLLAGSRKKWKC